VTIHLSAKDSIELQGSCTLEDAEILLQHLLANPAADVDWSACESAHTAVVQVLLVAGRVPLGIPLDPFLREKVAPFIRQKNVEIT
jgi:hypothetical protein